MVFVQAVGVEEQVEDGRPLAEELAEAERLVVGEEEKAATVVESVEVERVKARGRHKVK